MPTFTTVDRIVTGPGCFEELGALAASLGRRALLVTGARAMRAAGVTDRACRLLRASGVEPVLFDQVDGEPTDEHVDAARRLCVEQRCDIVIGLGGGSALDAAKAVAALANASAPTSDYVKGRTADAAVPLPCIAVPTTSGTGAEATPNAVITCPAVPLKSSIRGSGLLPKVAIVDPDLTLTCPLHVTAAAGMDALTQAIESYVSIHATPLTDALAFSAAELLLGHLAAACADGADHAARAACSHGSLMAGIALANARLGVVHGIAHPVGARYGVPHGVCCAILLAPSIRLNRAAARAKYDRLSAAAGLDIEQAVLRLLDATGLPRTLAAWSIPEADFPLIAAESMPSGSLKANPKKVTEADIIRLLREVAR